MPRRFGWVLIGWAQYTTCKMPVTYLGGSLQPYEFRTDGGEPPECTSLMAMAAEYTPTEVSQLLADGAIQLIDVRQPHEHEAGRIAGGRLIVLDHLTAEAATIDRSTPVVFYCRSGARSAMATEAFAAAGFDAHNMAGGLLAWELSGLPMEPDGAVVAEP
jgi:rhodanese-related sulfurtransferase